MSKFLPYLMVSFLCLSAMEGLSQPVQKKKNALETDRFKGKVKQVEQVQYSAQLKEGKVVQGKKISLFRMNYYLKYDEQGNYLEENFLTTTSGRPDNKNVYKYNELGILQRIDELNAANILVHIHLYQYDQKENQQTERIEDKNEKIIETDSIECDENGLPIYFKVHDRAGKVLSMMQVKHDAHGNITESSQMNAGGLLNRKVTVKYDDRNNVIEKCWYNANNQLKRRETARYGPTDEMIGGQTFNAKGKLKKSFTYQSEYDSQGNWTRQIRFQNDRPQYMLVRTFGYYE